MAQQSTLDHLRVLHDFEARSADELSLKKNSKIELLERDEEYNDGWYLGRDPESGKVGLFPQVYTAKWIAPSAQPQPSINVTDIADPPDGAPPPAYTSTTPTPVEPKQEIPKRLSVTPSELTLDEGKFGSSKDLAAETPPLSVENNDKRRISEDYKKDSPTMQKLMRSPVVEDTLSDIEEALSEIRTKPRSSSAQVQKNKQPPPILETPEALQPNHQDFDDSASDYSRSAFGNESSLSLAIGAQQANAYLDTQAGFPSQRQVDPSLQYSGQFSVVSSSDDEEDSTPVYSLDQVRGWTPEQVSAYFQSQNMPLNICDKFEEQEISGSILLQLEMAHLKELEIGSFGKRFEVWKEIENLKAMVGLGSGESGEMEKGKQARNRSSSTPAGMLPRLPSLHNQPPAKKGSLAVPTTHQEEGFDTNSVIRDSPTTMSPASPAPPPKSEIGSGGQSDRMSVSTGSFDRGSSSGGLQLKAHGRDPSFDRNWTLKGHKTNDSAATGRSRFTGDSGFASQTSSILANDRNYFSGDEGSKKDRNVLHKRANSSGGHSKKSSYTDETRSRSGNNNSLAPPPLLPQAQAQQQAPSPLPGPPSNDEPIGDQIAHLNTPSGLTSPASLIYHNSVKGRKRSTSETQQLSLDAQARQSIITTSMPGGKTLAVERAPGDSDATGDEKRVPPAIQTRATMPHRSVSDGGDKTMSPVSQDTGSTLMSPNGSEPSPSIKIIAEQPERRSHESKERNGSKDKKLRNVSSASGIRQKSKKQLTSAYQEGLREVSPSKAAEEADFSGWMKKRGSSAVVASWKSRFFVLKGRRLSYFYSMEDTKERGLIDITSHRVLPAADDRIVSLHASVAAITTSTPPSQASSANPGNGQSSPNLPPLPPQRGGWFTFKLVPPAPGAAKGVMFTPPKLHYFATDSKQIGRQWMAAFMKATIDRDESAPVVSTFSANTISLAKARAMRARPPGFGEPGGPTNNSNATPTPTTAIESKPPILGLPIMSSQASFSDKIDTALAEKNLEDDAANAADDER